MSKTSIPTQNNIRILGIDPGFGRLGIAIIDRENASKNALVYSTCIETPKEMPFIERLTVAIDTCSRLIDKYQPTVASLETLLFQKNQKTAFAVAEVRGALRYIFQKKQLDYFEYGPKQIKVAVTGHGASDKKQVTMMVEKLIELPKAKRLDDEYDALAVALTCSASERFNQ